MCFVNFQTYMFYFFYCGKCLTLKISQCLRYLLMSEVEAISVQPELPEA